MSEASRGTTAGGDAYYVTNLYPRTAAALALFVTLGGSGERSRALVHRWRAEVRHEQLITTNN